MIDTNNSSQDYFLTFKNSVIASIFVVLIHMARNHFITQDFFPFFSFKKNQSREKCNLVIYVMYWQTVSEKPRRSSLKYFDLERNYFPLGCVMILILITLIFPLSVPLADFHTHCFQLVCGTTLA